MLALGTFLSRFATDAHDPSLPILELLLHGRGLVERNRRQAGLARMTIDRLSPQFDARILRRFVAQILDVAGARAISTGCWWRN
jgi:hypothetical protein